MKIEITLSNNESIYMETNDIKISQDESQEKCELVLNNGFVYEIDIDRRYETLDLIEKTIQEHIDFARNKNISFCVSEDPVRHYLYIGKFLDAEAAPIRAQFTGIRI